MQTLPIFLHYLIDVFIRIAKADIIPEFHRTTGYRALYDLQTGELLAWAKNVKGKKAEDVPIGAVRHI
jgi:hypothetical protein